MKNNMTVGVMGGLGPMATVYFYEMVTRLTDAEFDQEHIDMVVLNRASTPDRTSFILGNSNENPSNIMKEDAKKLEAFGSDFVVITCNTAHYFHKEISDSLSIPVLNIIEETVKFAKNKGHKKLGILATTGNIKTEMYQNMCKKYNMEYYIPNEDKQKDVMTIIYENIKSGKSADMEKFNSLVKTLKDNDCDGAILGCTELSILKNDNNLDSLFYIDSLEVLARETILKCGKKIKE